MLFVLPPPWLTTTTRMKRAALEGLDRKRARNNVRQVGTSGSRWNESAVSRLLNNILAFARFAGYEIFFILFFLVAFFFFKNLTSRPEYSQILRKKPGGADSWPFQEALEEWLLLVVSSSLASHFLRVTCSAYRSCSGCYLMFFCMIISVALHFNIYLNLCVDSEHTEDNMSRNSVIAFKLHFCFHDIYFTISVIKSGGLASRWTRIF